MGGGGSERQKLARKTVDGKQESAHSLRASVATKICNSNLRNASWPGSLS